MTPAEIRRKESLDGAWGIAYAVAARSGAGIAGLAGASPLGAIAAILAGLTGTAHTPELQPYQPYFPDLDPNFVGPSSPLPSPSPSPCPSPSPGPSPGPSPQEPEVYRTFSEFCAVNGPGSSGGTCGYECDDGDQQEIATFRR